MDKKTIKIGTFQVEVNEDGSEVRVNGTLRKQSILSKTAYKQVHIGRKRFYVHRLVAMAFIQNLSPIANKFVIHTDGDINNNHHSNLKWASHKDLADVQRINRNKDPYKRNTGKPSKIKPEEVPGIVERLNNGETARSIAKEFDTSEMSIIRIRKRYCEVKTVSKKYQFEIKKTVSQFFKKGTPNGIIAKATGIPYHTVYKWRKAFDDGKFPAPEGVVLGLNGQPLVHGKRRSKIVD